VSTGLFQSHGSTAQGIGARAHQRSLRKARAGGGRAAQRAAKAAKLAAFAEALSEHGDTSRAAAAVGGGPSYGRVLPSRLRADLGWQAV